MDSSLNWKLSYTISSVLIDNGTVFLDSRLYTRHLWKVEMVEQRVSENYKITENEIEVQTGM